MKSSSNYAAFTSRQKMKLNPFKKPLIEISREETRRLSEFKNLKDLTCAWKDSSHQSWFKKNNNSKIKMIFSMK